MLSKYPVNMFLMAMMGFSGASFAAAHFNGEKEIRQTVDIEKAGMYDISFVYAPRDLKYYAGGRINVWIDDMKVGYADCDNSTMDFRRCMVRTKIDAGSHVFKLSHTLDNPVSQSNRPCSAFDDVSLMAADNLIMNGSFDMGTVYSNEGMYSDTSDEAGYSNPGWIVSGICGLAKPGYPDKAQLISDKIDSGLYSMTIQTANYNGRERPPVSISQTFSADASGVYDLSFSYASRPYSHYKGGTIYARIYKGEGLEGEKVWERSVVADQLYPFEQFNARVRLSEAGEYTLEFYAPQPEYQDSGENNRCSVLDNVMLKYARPVSGLVIVVR